MVEIKTSLYAKYVKASSDIDSSVSRMKTIPSNVLSHYISNMNGKEKLLCPLYLGLLVEENLNLSAKSNIILSLIHID